MQGVTIRNPSVARGGGAAIEAQSQACKVVEDGRASASCVPASKRNLGTPIRVPLDSNGQRLCPTPKNTRRGTPKAKPSSLSLNSPLAHNLRYQNVTFQPLDTIQSPPVVNTQTNGHVRSENGGGGDKSALRVPVGQYEQPMARRVLIDSNGQWAQGTPKVFKPVITPKVRESPLGITCLETMTPRALFKESEAVAAISAKKLIPTESTSLDPHTDTEVQKRYKLLASPAIRVRVPEKEQTPGTPARESVLKSNAKKRARDEGDPKKQHKVSPRLTRSKTEAEKIALFLRSPAVRVRVDDPQQKNLGTSKSSLKQPMEKKAKCAPTNLATSGDRTKQPGDAARLEDSSADLRLQPLEIVRRVWAIGSPATRVRVHSPGHKKSLLRSPLVTPSKRSEQELAKAGGRWPSAKQAGTKRNLTVGWLEDEN